MRWKKIWVYRHSLAAIRARKLSPKKQPVILLSFVLCFFEEIFFLECLVGVVTVLIDIGRARTIRDIQEGRKNVPGPGHRSKESTISNGNQILNAMTHMMNTEGAILQVQG